MLVPRSGAASRGSGGSALVTTGASQKFGHVCECRGVRRRRRRGGGAPFRTCSGGRGGGAPDNQERVPAAQLRRAKRGFARNRTLFLANGTSAEPRYRGAPL